MDYYSKKLFLAQVDKEDRVLGKIERWEAHEKGVLHRGFTVILFYDKQVVLQHRKHPAFNGFWDLTFSSHQVYLPFLSSRAERGISLQTDLEAIYEALKREWNVDRDGLKTPPKFLGKIYYKARDPKSIYTEHEVDYIFSTALKNKPNPNPDFAYGYKLVPSEAEELKIKNLKLKIELAPWVKNILGKKMV